ncbi:hypothetical protein BIY26_10900 [Brenneria goodwinii]|uniref:Uncharacterized protein n=1 Tax=Brenneria goodwinii TaxID=1109412 RepID=A0AAE8ERE2_9GAMM|nr:hypothetical protein AWC36_16455 [Brenneria goodwinii]RLM24206.1 hypothetical protein BIY26_10900 [Brenneria goodwinii]
MIMPCAKTGEVSASFATRRTQISPNQDFDVITGADTMESAIDAVVAEATPEERNDLRKETSPDYAKTFLTYFLS